MSCSMFHGFFKISSLENDFFQISQLVKKYFLLFLGWAVVLDSLSGQGLPEQIYLSSDGRMLITGNKPAEGLYDSATIRKIYLDFPQTGYWQLLRQNYSSQTEIPATLTVDGVKYDSVGIRFKGETSYFQLPPNAQKMSFNISIDFARADQRLLGYKTLNLNNAFQDESFLREVFYLHQIRKHIPAAKANFVQLFINGENWGPYPNIQQLNKDFLEEWFLSNDGANWRAERPDNLTGPGGQWGDGTAALNYLGTDTSTYQKYYHLKSSDIPDGWSRLAATCNALNNTPIANLPDILPVFLDIDRTLWHLATEIAFSDDDSYVHKGKNDYYVYYEPETERITPIEYDGNSVMNPGLATWSPFYNETKVNYPLLNRMLAVPQWRQRYLAHLRTIVSEELDPVACSQILDNYKNQIDLLVQNDPKKLYSYTQFANEFNVLKNFINARRNSLLNNGEFALAGPAILSVDYFNSEGKSWTPPAEQEATYVQTMVTSLNGINRVNLYYSNHLTGNFNLVQMFDDGKHQDQLAGDGIFAAPIPGQAAGTWVRFYVEAISGNSAKTASYLPAGAEHDVYVYIVKSNAAAPSGIVVNELMASNAASVKDNYGEYEDWIELFNNTDKDVDLSGYFLSDNPANLPKWEIPASTVIPAKGYLIFWADEDQEQGVNHTNFKLTAGGEVVVLLDRGRNIVDSVAFGAQIEDKGYARVPNGTGSFFIQSPTFNSSNDLATPAIEPTLVLSEISIFPNPANSELTIFLPQQERGDFLEVVDANGRLVLRKSVHQAEIRVDVSDWPSGLYFVRFGAQRGKALVVR